MFIHEIYAEKMNPDKMMDVAEHNCDVCMKRCNNLICPSMKALMDSAEKTHMTSEQKKRYFQLVGA